MNTEPDCIFCRIVAGRSPSTTIARTERAIAFMDLNPVTPGHVLVIPRSHAADLLDVNLDDLAACIHLAQQMGQRASDRLGADGVNLLNPRYEDDPGRDRIGPPWETVASTPDEIDQIGRLLS